MCVRVFIHHHRNQCLDLLRQNDKLTKRNETLQLELESARRQIQRLKAKDEQDTYIFNYFYCFFV